MTPDLAAEDRWPQFSRRASEETGIRSMIGFRLFVREDTLGALNLYSSQVAGFEGDATALGAVFASHAALAMATPPSTSTARTCRTRWSPAGPSAWPSAS